MSTPTSSRRRRLAPAQRRLELLDAGERVIRRVGGNARVEDVVRAAHAAKGTFYVYFETWDTFLLSLRERALLHLEEQFNRFYRDCRDWVQLIGGLPDLFIEMTLSLEGLHPALFHGAVARVPATSPRLDVIDAIGGLLAHGTRRQALQSPDVAITSRLVFSLLHEAADLVEAGGNRRRTAAALAALLLNALQVQPVKLTGEVPHSEN